MKNIEITRKCILSIGKDKKRYFLKLFYYFFKAFLNYINKHFLSFYLDLVTLSHF